MSSLLINICLFVIIVSPIYCATAVSDCEDIKQFVSVTIRDCEQPPCLLHRGTNAGVEIVFDAPMDSNQLTTLVNATTVFGTITYPLPDSDACHFLSNGYCPIDKDERLVYTLEMPVLAIYPKINLELEFSLIDDSNIPFGCFRVQCKVVS